MIQDSQGRSFRKLRLSVTGRCNYSCLYCVPESRDASGFSAGDIALRRSELSPGIYESWIRSIHEVNGLSEIRLTGGEPLLYRPLPELVRKLKAMGIPRVTLTTNGSLLAKRAQELCDAGIDSVNVSLDSLDSDSFRFLSRGGDLEDVRRGLDVALGLDIPVKLNATILRGINDDQVVPLLRYARDHGVRLRYIELMAMGHMADRMERYFYSQDEILASIAGSFSVGKVHRRDNMPARYWELSDGYRFGIIANTSDPFCSTCDRLRMDASGIVYGCLSVNEGQSLPGILHGNSANSDGQSGHSHRIGPESVAELLKQELRRKQDSRFVGSSLSMQAIGG